MFPFSHDTAKKVAKEGRKLIRKLIIKFDTYQENTDLIK